MDLQDAITRMQHLVLSWDYFEMFDDSHKSDKGSESKRETKQRQARDLVAVPDTFDSVEVGMVGEGQDCNQCVSCMQIKMSVV